MPTNTNVVPGIPAIPDSRVEDKNLQATLDALKEAIEVITGSRGDPNSRAVTVGEATENGQTDLFVTNRVTETAQNGALSTRLNGDIVGTGLFEDGRVVVPTAIQLPNIIRIDGGAPDTSYTSQLAGPYGIEGTPAGGTTGQVFGKLSDTDFDYGWITQSGGGGGGGLPDGGTAGQFLIKDSATNGDASWQDWSGTTIDGLFSPGYPVSQVSTTSFTVDGFDVTYMFRVNRRMKFNGGGVDSYGIIASSSYSAPDTTITMTMEDSGTVPSTISDYWFSSSTAYWAPIATDPFSGTPIVDIATGEIGGTQWWVAVGDDGKIFTSTDKGVTWTSRTSGTTGDLTSVAYSANTESFLVGGSQSSAAGYLLIETTNGSTFTDRGSTTGTSGDNSFTVASAAGDYIFDIAYNNVNGYWVICYFDASTPEYKTTIIYDNWITPTNRASGSTPILVAADGTPGATGGSGWDYSIGVSGVYYDSFADASGTGWTGETNTTCTGMYAFTCTGTNFPQTYIARGTATGGIDFRYRGNTGAVVDQTTFSTAINGFAASSADRRLVCVGDLGVIGYFAAADVGFGSKFWTEISNGFSPTTSINAVAYNETDGVFVAVATNGQICRSTSGVN